MENNMDSSLQQAKEHFNDGLQATKEVSQALKKIGSYELSEKFEKMAAILESFTDEDIAIIKDLSPEDIGIDEEKESEGWLKEPTC